eukprot:CAMPEP_0180149766 /NCGR_PEP_ID=MMETSP0986-20121125/21010_1 /TAXON_ID=697907 /ORGANISM="non described non described, Strain CCMP2293" /LENGTH=53 /DNA_ID=CAMNT_0022096495 /DNA_START=221 /DNA_END=379 /DNA_ORIENTATION=-
MPAQSCDLSSHPSDLSLLPRDRARLQRVVRVPQRVLPRVLCSSRLKQGDRPPL